MERMIFGALFEHSTIGIIISNDEGTIEKCNTFAAQMFGYEQGELIGKQVEILLPEHLRDKHVFYRKGYNANPHPRSMGSSLDLKALKKNDTTFPVEVSLSFFQQNDQFKIVSFVNDITARKLAQEEKQKADKLFQENLKKLNEELEEKVLNRTKELSDSLVEINNAHRALEEEVERRKKVEGQIRLSLEKEKELSELKSRFVSMASHEFRTPLGGILSSASLLSNYNKPGFEEKHAKHVNTIKKSVKHLTTILNEFLSLDKLNQGMVKPHPSTFKFEKFAKDVIEGVLDQNEKEINFVIEHETRSVELFQDQDILKNVLINLISNAIKYSGQGGNVYFQSKTNGDFLTIKIQDEGIGIPEADQKHLFERFFRAHNVNTIQGTGLGLNIVKNYLDLLSGNIDFYSEENKGTTFTVNIPLGI